MVSEPWMALPLFKRQDSPDHTRDVLVWPPTTIDFDMTDLDCDFFHDYDLMDYEDFTPTGQSDISRPHSDSITSVFTSDVASNSSHSSGLQSEAMISAFPPSTTLNSPTLSNHYVRSTKCAFPSHNSSDSSDAPKSQGKSNVSASPPEVTPSPYGRRAASIICELPSEDTSQSLDPTNSQAESIVCAFLSDAIPHSSDTAGLQADSIISGFHSDSGYESHVFEANQSPKRRNLLNEISDEHIPQPVFTGPCQCTFENCKSTTVFTTGRDFRRHYRQHFKRFFCRYEECPQSTDVPGDADTKGFATRKDRARHEAKHNPDIKCPWQNRNGTQCTRTFSRMDNMRDHYRRIHKKECKT
jgi:hypothetical protein